MKSPDRFLRHIPSLRGVSLSLLLVGTVALSAAESPVIAATAPVVAAAAVARPNTAIIPVPQRSEDKLPPNAISGFNTRHERYVGLAKQGEIDLLFLGDSITQNWGGVGKEVWAQYYGNMKAAAFGIGYDRTQHLLWRLQHGEGEGFSPKVVVIMIGTNNIGLNTPPEIAVGIGAIVHEVRTRFASAKILLLGIFPRNTKDSSDRHRVAEVNQLIAPLNDGQHVFFLDLADKFIGPDGAIPAALMADRAVLHPTAQGHAVWAEAMKESLGELLK